MVSKRNIGFIGIGAMGGNMAKRLIEKGFDVTVCDVDPGRVKELEDFGASSADSIEELTKTSEIIMTSLPGPDEVKEVILGENGILKMAEDVSVIIDTSTIDPDTIKKVEEEAEKINIEVLGAPVSGSPQKAREGTLTIIVGGKEDILNNYRDVLQTIGDTVNYAGSLGSGKAVKLVNNVMSMGNVLVAAEAFTLGVKGGADPSKLYDILCSSRGRSVQFVDRFARILKRNFEPGFTINLAEKDLELATKMAKENKLPIIMTSIIHEMYVRGQALGKGNLDIGGIVQLFEEEASLKIEG